MQWCDVKGHPRVLEGESSPFPSALVHLESGQTLQFYARPNLMRERDRKEGSAATVIPSPLARQASAVLVSKPFSI